ncbi:MAG: hypothetical protein ABI887_04955, partial [Burkholderiales bacterium]
QINGAVTQLDQMTQQNSALVEQSAAAAESLREQAVKLSDVVATFKLDGHPAAASPRPASAAARKPVPAPIKPAAAAARPPAPRTAPGKPIPTRVPTLSQTVAVAKPSALATSPAAADEWESF